MSSTATTTRELAGIMPAANMNLNVFSHPPVKQKILENTTLEAHLMPVITSAKSSAPQPQLSDDEDIFNLDMVTMDMDFEQAYNMYTQIQQKTALSEVEDLQRAQQLNHSQSFGGHRQEQKKHIYDGATFSPYDSGHETLGKDWIQTPKQWYGNPRSQSHAHVFADFASNHTGNLSIPTSQEDMHSAGRHVSLPNLTREPLITPPGESIEGMGEAFAGPHAQLTRSEKEFFAGHNDGEDADQFFSTTESSALDKFLDNLAFSSEVNPLEFYHQNQPKIPHMFEMQTMGQDEQYNLADSLKTHTTSAFQDYSGHNMKAFNLGGNGNLQLQTPDTLLTQVQTKRSREDSVTSETTMKKRKKSTKPLLSLTQKRLNHSHSEQKRRLLCKEAYDRCLRLVTNVDDYKNELVSASTSKKPKKKSKRKQLNKDGLPNLSKHSALLKISGEIMKIQNKNDQLRKLLQQS